MCQPTTDDSISNNCGVNMPGRLLQTAGLYAYSCNWVCPSQLFASGHLFAGLQRTERELLCQPLPHYMMKISTTKRVPSKMYVYQPAEVKLWKQLRPGDPSSQLLTDAIIARQEGGDNRKRRWGAR